MADNIVDFRRIGRFAGRVTITPIYTRHLGDKETGLLKRNLDKVGYRYIGRSKDNLSNPNWYGTQEAAITAALKWIKDWLQRQIKVETNKNNSVCKNANKLLTEIEKILPKQRYVQLDLFEF